MKRSQALSRILDRLLKVVNIAPSQGAQSKVLLRNDLVWGKRHSREKQAIFFKARRYRKLIGVVFLFFCFSVFLFGFIFGSWFQLTKIEIIPEGILGNEGIAKTTVFDASIQKFGFLHTSNLFFVDSQAVEQALYKNFPEIKRVSIHRRFPQMLLATVEKRNEAALYCVSEEKQKCYFVDEEGVGWKEAPQIIGSAFIKIFEERKSLALGDTFILSRTIQAAIAIAKRAHEENKFSIEDFKITSSSEIRASTSQGFSILLDTNELIDAQLNVLFLILEKEIPVTQWGNVEYIDLRIPNRVYYKFKQ